MNYSDYYSRTIESNLVGLKLVLGGTGLGKTSAIPEVVRNKVPTSRKCIYIANRNQLLAEMAAQFKPEEYIFLKRDLEVVLDTVKVYKKELYSLLNDPNFKGQARKINEVDLTALRKSCHSIEQFAQLSEEVLRLVEKPANADARRILNSFRLIIQETKNHKMRDYFLNHPVIQSLFPFIAFQRQSKVRLLLVTLHKAYHGFFDGQNRVNLTNLSGYVIFMDEFDFLENDLIKLICSSPQVSDIFKFVELFVEEMRRHKLPLSTYPGQNYPDLRTKILNVMDIIDKLNGKGVKFPETNQFISSLQQKNVAIFRTSHTIKSKPLFLLQTARAFDIKERKVKGKTFNANELFSTVAQVAELIIAFFKELELRDKNIYDEIKQQCFKDTAFDKQLEDIIHPPQIRKNSFRSQLDALLNYGYNLYDVYHLEQRTDHEEVELRNFSIYTTPENILATLIRSNLVFGLSATADMPRCLFNFDLTWLNYQDGVKIIDLIKPILRL